MWWFFYSSKNKIKKLEAELQQVKLELLDTQAENYHLNKMLDRKNEEIAKLYSPTTIYVCVDSETEIGG